MEIVWLACRAWYSTVSVMMWEGVMVCSSSHARDVQRHLHVAALGRIALIRTTIWIAIATAGAIDVCGVRSSHN